MRKSNFKILALTAALIMPLSSCKETIIYVTPEDTPNDDIKTPIELSVGGVDGAVETSSTRAVITDGTSKTLKPFDKKANIFMIFKSEYDTNNPDFKDSDNPHKVKYTISRGDVAISGEHGDGTTITFDEKNQKYWDDAHARSTMLTIWAYAQKEKTNWTECTFQHLKANATGSSLNDYEDKKFQTTNYFDWNQVNLYPGIKEWRPSIYTDEHQDATTLICQDLLFCNYYADFRNRTDVPETQRNDNRLKFDFDSRKFPNNVQLKFYHAMSKLTLKVVEGDGFDKTTANKGNDFNFETGKNVELKGFNTKGVFNIKTGQFEYIHERKNIPYIAVTTATSSDGTTTHTAQALVIPNIHGNTAADDDYSKFKKESTDISMEFSIDGNNYKLKQKDLFEAIKRNTSNKISETDTEIKLEAGKNYIFTFVVGKTKIEHLTATVAEWEDVEAESYTPIIDVNQNYGEKGSESDLNKTYTLLRSTTKAGSYGNGSCSDGNSAKMEYNTTDNKYKAMTPQLYWPDHKTHYFFRGVYPNIDTSTGHPTLDDTGKLINVSNCAYTKETSPSDLMIGIPRNADGSFDETCKVDGTGHKSSSAKGICATSGNINLNFRYAMSQVEVRLSTVTGDAAVNLANAKVEIVNGYTNGTIALSDGGAAVTESTGNYELHTAPTGDNRDGVATTNIRHDAIVPQNLTNGTTTNLRFKITIYKAGSTTEIDDIYYADIKDINVKVGTADPTTITSWEAGKHYIYTLNLKKTEIKVSATITDWVTATGSTNVWF